MTAERAFECIQNHLPMKGKEIKCQSKVFFHDPRALCFRKNVKGYQGRTMSLYFSFYKLVFSLRGTLQCALGTKWQKDCIVWIHGWKHMIVSSVSIRWEIWSEAMIKEFNGWARERKKKTFPEGSTW